MSKILLLIFLFFSLHLKAAQITNVKDSRVLIVFEGEASEPGTQFFVINQEGKKIGLVEVRKVKGEKAIAEIVKGRAEIGGELIPRSSAPVKKSEPEAEPKDEENPDEEKPKEDKESSLRKSKLAFGALAGYASNSMSLTVQSATNSAVKTDATFSGTNFNFKGFLDYEMSKDLNFRSTFGYEPYVVKGTATTSSGTYLCNNGASANCQINITYFALDGMGQYNLVKGSKRIWLGLGYSLLVTMSKSIDVPNFSQTGGTNQMLLLGVGADFNLNKTSFIPISVEYGMIPGDNVKASAYYLRTGYGRRF